MEQCVYVCVSVGWNEDVTHRGDQSTVRWSDASTDIEEYR